MATLTPAPSSACASPAFDCQLKPVHESARIRSVDVIRGVAVLGILLMNIVAMGLPFEAYADPTVAGGADGWNLKVWVLANLCFEGTMRALFTMLFGAGVLLFAAKDDDKAVGVSIADAYYRRVIWLFLFGLLHAYVLLWPGDILYSYGLMGMFLFPLRRLAPGNLFTIGLALLLAGAGAYLADHVGMLRLQAQAAAAENAQAQGMTLSPEQQAALKDWKTKLEEFKPPAEQVEETIRNVRAGYFSAMKQLAGYTYLFESAFHYRYDYFDILSMMLLGMALFKWRVFHAALPTRVYATMMLGGYLVGLSVNGWETQLILSQQFSVTAYSQAALTYDLGRLGMMAGHIGLIMMFCRLPGARRWTTPLAAVGQMALTNYILHTVIATVVFVGLKQYGQWERHQLYGLVLGIWVLQLTLSPTWLRFFHFGPLEWLWRTLVYLRPQAFRRSSAL